MSPKQKSNKIYVVALIFFLVGAVLAVIGFGLTGFQPHQLGRDPNTEIQKIEITEAYTGVYLADTAAQVKIVASPDEKTYLTYEKSPKAPYQIEVAGNGILTIKRSPVKSFFSSIFGIRSHSADLQLEVPTAWKGSMEAKINAGDLNIQDLQLDRLKASVNAGDLQVHNLQADGKIECSVDLGQVTLRDIRSQEDVEIHTDTGDALAENVKARNLSVSCDLGQASAKGDNKAYTLTISADTGSVEVEGGEFQKIDASTDLGDIRLHLAGSANDYFVLERKEKSRLPFDDSKKIVSAFTDIGKVSINYDH